MGDVKFNKRNLFRVALFFYGKQVKKGLESHPIVHVLVFVVLFFVEGKESGSI